MPKVVEYICKGCGGKRREANHWWEITGFNDLLLSTRYAEHVSARVPPALVLRRFTGADGVEFFCGRACVNKEIEAWMESQSAAVAATTGEVPSDAHAD